MIHVRVRTGLARQLAAAILPVVLCGAAAPDPRCTEVRSVPGQEAQALSILRSMLSAAKEKCVILSGRFALAKPLRVTAAGSGLQLRSLPARPAMLVATHGAARGIEVIGASNVLIEGIGLSGFAHDGIFASNSRNLTIRSVMVEETGSNAWSQGGIHLTGTSTGALVEGNTVEGADYAGIIVDTNAASDVSDIKIWNNRVMRSCRRVHDCGAIYVNDWGRRSRNILIADNIVTNFGAVAVAVAGRAIYIDDWASHVTVRGNRIAGPGRFAFQIHGRHDNLITGNSIHMAGIASPLLYQAAMDGTRTVMTRNGVADNVFTHRAGGRTAFTPGEHAGAGAVRLRRNRQCIARSCTTIPWRPPAKASPELF